MAEHPSLLLGGMELYDVEGAIFDCEVLVEGTSRGRAVPIREAIQTFLEQGAIEVTQGWESRDVPVRVTFTADDLDGLASAEAALFGQVGIRNQLVWTDYHPEIPGDHLGTPIVFEVINSWLDPVEGERWDLDETDPRPSATYQVTLVCESFVHSATLTVVEALATAGAESTSTVDDGSSAAGWTGFFDGASIVVAQAGGMVQFNGLAYYGSDSAGNPNQPVPGQSASVHGIDAVVPAAALPVDVSTEQFVVVRYKVNGVQASLTYIQLAVSHVDEGFAPPRLSPVAVLPTATPEVFEAYFDTGPLAVAEVTSMRVQGGIVWGGSAQQSPATIGLWIDNIATTNVHPSLLSVKQQARMFDVGGSAPAKGSVSVEHESEALGDLILFTEPDTGNGQQPSCRLYRVSGGTVVADAAAVSGSVEPLNASPTFDVPIGVLTDAEYLVMLRVVNESAAEDTTVNWSCVTRMNGTDISDTEVDATDISVDVDTAAFVRLGMIHLPVAAAVAGPTAFQRVTVDGTDADWNLDDLYLMNMSDGQLTEVACGTGAGSSGASSRRVWVDSPSLDNDGIGAIWRGHAADRSDAFSAYPVAESIGGHRFDPRRPVKVFTITTNPTTSAAARFEYYAAALSRLPAGV